ncbi:MAG: hypothetical protein ABWJ98_00580 [Hydrogenothermaceae bacterium]
MSEPIQLKVILPDVDLSNTDEETVSKLFIEEMKKLDYLPTDNYVALRDKK